MSTAPLQSQSSVVAARPVADSIWGSTEAKKAATGVLPEPKDANHQLYLGWIRDCDARKCHSLALTDASVDPLLRARALLFRGALADAGAQIRSLLEQPGASRELRGDALLESARLAAYEGEWTLARELATAALDSGAMEPVSYLSALQVRALASFELGRLLDAKADLVSAESLGAVFPHSISWHYARVLAARIAARDEGTSVGLQGLDGIWRELCGQGQPTIEQAHALYFGEIDVLRHEVLRDPALAGDTRAALGRLVLASAAMTDAMGERLYSALACVDAAVCGPRETRSWFRRQAEGFRAEFRRVDRLCHEVFGEREASSQSASVLRGLHETPTDTQYAAQRSPVVRHILDSRRKRMFGLPDSALSVGWKVIALAPHARVLRGLQALATGPRSKSGFFSATWGAFKYAPHLHDSSISNLLNRIRKVTGVRVRVRAGIVEPPEDLLVI